MSDSIRMNEGPVQRGNGNGGPSTPKPVILPKGQASARTALAEQQGEGPSDKELNILWNCSGIADEHGNHTGNIFEFARAVLARWGRQPAPHDDRGVLPMVISDTGASDEPERERIICASISGGADYINNMPRMLILERIELHKGSICRRYIQEPTPPAEGEVAELVAALQADAECVAAEQPDLMQLTDKQLARAAELLQQQEAKIESLEQQLETERMRVVACGIIATSDTPLSAAKNRNCHPDYWSASADDIARQIDELMRLRAQQTPVPVSERLPGDQLCWWYEPDEWLQGQGGWTLLRIWGGTGTYSHWLPATSLPLPQGEAQQ